MLQKKNLEQLWILFKSMFLLKRLHLWRRLRHRISYEEKGLWEELKWLEEDEGM